jgi:formamidopyrimidine-DNA glycosylase
MPELPEVEYAKAKLLSLVGRHAITDAFTDDPIVVPQSAASFRAALVGRHVQGADRRGKNVLLRLSEDHALWFHLGMSGQVVPSKHGEPLPRFTRWWIETSRVRVCLCDARRLGRAFAGPREEVLRRAKWDALGPDALSLKSAEAFRDRLSSAKGPIKAALMDQQRIAGLGNIQVGEMLWLAKVHPARPVPSLDRAVFERLLESMHETLSRSIARAEAEAELVYVEAGGPNPFLVYDREGEPCPRCGSTIVREVSQGRATYFCKRCQRAPRSTEKSAR